MINKAEIGRFDGDYKKIAFNEGDSIQSLIEKSGLSLGRGERIEGDSGNEILTSSPAVNGETYNIVGNYKQGSNCGSSCDLEEVKKYEANLLADSIKDVDEERAKYRLERAKEVLREILGRKDVADFNLEQAKNEVKAIDKELSVFNKKG